MQANNNNDYVREVRAALDGAVTYEVTPGDVGSATWIDISRVGVRMVLGRYLRPGRVIAVAFAAPWDEHTEVRLSARVIWCRQTNDSAEFHAGFQVLRESPEAALAFGLLVQQAREAANSGGAAAVFHTVWPSFRVVVDRQPQPEALAFKPMAV
jgi:hypothetical protein